MSLSSMMNPKPPTPPDAQKFDDVLKETKTPLRSWRKKYRKMKQRFDRVMDDSNNLFKDCHKLEIMAKRLQEDIDANLEVLLHLNESRRIPSYDLGNVFYDVNAVPSEHAVPPLDHDYPRSLAQLLNIPHTEPHAADPSRLPPDMLGDPLPGFLTTAYEEEYLAHLDTQLASPDSSIEDGWRLKELPRSRQLPPEKELLNANPMSVLSWLRKYHPETFIQEKEAAAEKAGKSRGGPVTISTGGASKRGSLAAPAGNGGTPQSKDEAEEGDEEFVMEEKAAIGRGGKKTKDDEAYRPKGGSSRPAKRKRTGEEGEKAPRGGKRSRASGVGGTPG